MARLPRTSFSVRAAYARLGFRARMSRPLHSVVLLLATLLFAASLVACGDENAQPPPAPTTPDAEAGPIDPPDSGADADAAPPPKATFPEVQSRGGPVQKTGKVLPIVFPGDPLKTQITQFTQKIATSQYWKDVGAEYAVGALTPLDTIELAETAPTSIKSKEIETWLIAKLSGATPELGAPDPNTLYAIYYPPGTTVTMEEAGELGQSCEGYGGYHYEVKVGTVRVGYAVMPRCTDLDELTITASHEYFEWATDPFPASNPAYAKLDDAHWAWQAAFIGELSDLCTFLDRDNMRPAEIGFLVQRHWSNKLSLGGKYPCAPTTGKTGPYLQAIPFPEDTATVPDYGVTPTKYIDVKAIRVPPGGTKTVDVLVYSDIPQSEQVPMRALPYDEFYGGTSTSGFTFKLERDYAKVGDRVKMTVKAPTKIGYELVVMLAYTGEQSANYWPALVVNDDEPDIGVGRKPVITPETLPKKYDRIANPFQMREHRRNFPRAPRTKIGPPRPRQTRAPTAFSAARTNVCEATSSDTAAMSP